MKYVHVFTGQESAEVDEGALHWPWVAPGRLEIRDRVARARAAAREAVRARLDHGTITQAERASRSSSDAADEVRRARRRASDAARRAARAAAAVGEGGVDSSEASSDA